MAVRGLIYFLLLFNVARALAVEPDRWSALQKFTENLPARDDGDEDDPDAASYVQEDDLLKILFGCDYEPQTVAILDKIIAILAKRDQFAHVSDWKTFVQDQVEQLQQSLPENQKISEGDVKNLTDRASMFPSEAIHHIENVDKCETAIAFFYNGNKLSREQILNLVRKAQSLDAY